MIRGRALSDGNLTKVAFVAVNLPASSAAAPLTRLGNGKISQVTAPASGFIVGVAVDSSAAPTAGTNVFTPTISGTKVAGVALNDLATSVPLLDTAGTSTASVRNVASFKAGDSLGVVVDTSVGFLPNAAEDFIVTLLIAYDVVVRND